MAMEFHLQGRTAMVAWRPLDKDLHYTALYFGIYEYLRAPPCLDFLARAEDYLRSLLQFPHAPMQQHRIRWTRRWIDATKALHSG